MGIKTAGRNAGILAVCAVVAATVAGGALAAGLSTESKTVVVDTGEAASATAKCKQGEKVVSGGFESPTASSDQDPLVLVHDSVKRGAKRWTAAALNFSDESAGAVTSFAYCRESRRLRTKSVSTIVSPEDGIVSLTPKCRRGEKAVSGGFENPDFGPTSQVFAFESRKQGGRKWKVSGVSINDGVGTLAAHVNCRPGKGLKKASKTATAGASIFEMGGDVIGSGEATAKCDTGQRVISGGFANPDFGLERETTPQLFATTSKRKGNRKWTVSVLNNGEVEGTLKAFAYCEKK